MPFFQKFREVATASRSRDVKDAIKHLSTVMGFSRNLGSSHLIVWFFTGVDEKQDENR